MKTQFWLDQIPLWGWFATTVVIVLLSVWVGTAMGNRRRRQSDVDAEAPLGSIIAATLALLGFLLAFTFGIAANYFQTRRQLLLNEVNSIGTTWLRAGLLLEPHRDEVRKLLREYVDLRAGLAQRGLPEPEAKLSEVISRSEALQDQLWSQAEAVAGSGRNSVMDALFIHSLNEMIDLQTSRVTALKYRIPTAIWYVLYFITVLTMGTVGYQAGLQGKNSHKIALILALTFSAMIWLVADLDRATEGRFQVSQQPMLELQKKVHSPGLPPAAGGAAAKERP